MQMWTRGWLVLALIVVAGCSSDSARESDSRTEAVVEDTSFYTARLPALEAAMERIATKRLYSGHYFPNSVVNGAHVEGPDLFVTLFNANTRHHEVHCVDVAAGRMRWMVDLGEVGLKFPPRAGDRFVVCVLDRGAGMVVVARSNGSREFRMTTPLRLIPSGSAPSSESTVYVSSLVDDRIYAVDPDTGLSGWHWRTQGTMTSAPQVTPRLPRRLVVVGNDAGEVVAIPAIGWNEPGPEAPAWSRKLLGDVTETVAIAETMTAEGHDVYVVVPCEDKGLYCLDAATGDSRWVVRTSSPFRAAPQVAGGKVFARNLDRLVVADLATGAQPWGAATEDRQMKPWESYRGIYTADQTRVYMMGPDKHVARVGAKTGELLSQTTLDEFDMVVPSGQANVLVGVTRDGHLVGYQ